MTATTTTTTTTKSRTMRTNECQWIEQTTTPFNAIINKQLLPPLLWSTIYAWKEKFATAADKVFAKRILYSFESLKTPKY